MTASAKSEPALAQLETSSPCCDWEQQHSPPDDSVRRNCVVTLKSDSCQTSHAIMGIFNKHCSKWHLMLQWGEHELQLSVEQSNGKPLKLHLRKVSFDPIIGLHRLDIGDGKEGQHKLCKVVDVAEVQSIKGMLQAVAN